MAPTKSPSAPAGRDPTVVAGTGPAGRRRRPPVAGSRPSHGYYSLLLFFIPSPSNNAKVLPLSMPVGISPSPERSRPSGGTTSPATLARPQSPDTYRALAGQSRQALLEVLQRVGGPLDAASAGEAVGLHPNTARAQLDLLCSAGLVTRRPEDRTRRGRPRVLYALAPVAGSVLDGKAAHEAEPAYRELARLLAQQFFELPDVSNEALRAGRRWAALLDRFPLTEEKISRTEAVGVLIDFLNRLGFHPETDPSCSQIRLGRCPFLELARESAAVVCGIHLGMLKATVERLNAPLDVAGLEPFVSDDPSVCIVHLAERGPPGPDERS